MKFNSSVIWLVASVFLLLSVRSAQVQNSSTDLLVVEHNNPTLSGSLEPEVTGQDKLDTMVRALKHLPSEELTRLGVNLDETIFDGSPEAEALRAAWDMRQAELKEAMKTLMDPPEYMSNLTARLISPESDTNAKIQILLDLESLLGDIDNARDFHTVGLWPSLTSMLQPHHDARVRAHAAWAVGTAVKNSYDYQLWMLESVSTTVNGIPLQALGLIPELKAAVKGDVLEPLLQENGLMVNSTVLELLINCLAIDIPSVASGSENDTAVKVFNEVVKRTLYALSSGLRGNIDVQTLAQVIAPKGREDFDVDAGQNQVWLVNKLKQLAVESVEIVWPETARKIWSLSSDLLQERAFIRNELDQLITAGVNSEDVLLLRSSVLLGDVFLGSANWHEAAVEVLHKYSEMLKNVVLASDDADRASGDANNIKATLFNVIKTLGELTAAPVSEVEVDLLYQHSRLQTENDIHFLASLRGETFEEISSAAKALGEQLATVGV